MNVSRGLAALSLLACASVVTRAQNPAGPLPMPRLQFFDSLGNPLAGGKVYTYSAGTSTLLGTYTDASGSIFNTNPIVLDAAGRAAIWVKTGVYKIIVQDSNGVQQWTADNVSNTGQYIAGGLGGFATVDGSGRLPASQLTLYSPAGSGAVSRAIAAKLGESVSMEDFAGADCGAQINAAYAALPASGGVISVHSSCSFATSINFGAANKPVVLQGIGAGSTLTYTGSGTALQLNNGRNFDLSTGLRDLVFTGPGSSSAAVGVLVGGSQGCVGCSLEHVVIQNFGTGLKYGDNTWVTSTSQSMIRANGVNLFMPSGMTEAGENVQFNHVTFADAPAPHTNSVWVQGGGQEVDFTDCSFDHVQLRIGNGATSAAQVNIKGSHFENPDYALTGSVAYDYLTVDNHNGNLVRISDSYFLQDNSTAGVQVRFAAFNGGKIVLHGIGMFTPGSAPMTNFATVANAVNIDFFSFSDLSGNVTGPLLGGSTTGYVSMFTGANPGSNVPRNAILKQGDTVGGASLDVAGNIRSSFQLVSLAATGSAPLVVNSTTPVQNLFASPTLYSAAGTQTTNTVHFVQGSTALAAGAATITLSGAAVFTNSSSYSCWGVDTTAAAAVKLAASSGTQFTITGTGTDTIAYSCLGY
jgi:hypothetical protein